MGSLGPPFGSLCPLFGGLTPTWGGAVPPQGRSPPSPGRRELSRSFAQKSKRRDRPAIEKDRLSRRFVEEFGEKVHEIDEIVERALGRVQPSPGEAPALPLKTQAFSASRSENARRRPHFRWEDALLPLFFSHFGGEEPQIHREGSVLPWGGLNPPLGRTAAFPRFL